MMNSHTMGGIERNVRITAAARSRSEAARDSRSAQSPRPSTAPMRNDRAVSPTVQGMPAATAARISPVIGP